jgi:hydrogenase expression/formation protein HypD
MLRVPVMDVQGEADSLYRARERGSDVRITVSPMDALAYARANPSKQVVWFGVGFETTAPHTAALVRRARERGIDNLSVLCAHKTMPAALTALLSDNHGIDALLLPGHVAVITGADAFAFVPQTLCLPAAISGFEAEEITAALCMIASIRKSGAPALVNAYPGAVTAEGNTAAQALMREVFAPCAASWRGLGEIKDSGLALRAEFAQYDARNCFDISKDTETERPTACRCAEVLRGAVSPRECPLFGKACAPDTPYGPCMVSSEGACSAAYLYGEE